MSEKFLGYLVTEHIVGHEEFTRNLVKIGEYFEILENGILIHWEDKEQTTLLRVWAPGEWFKIERIMD